jgi:hypothetical protein
VLVFEISGEEFFLYRFQIKVSQRPEAHPAGERIVNQIFTLPIITACQAVTYMRLGISDQ